MFLNTVSQQKSPLRRHMYAGGGGALAALLLWLLCLGLYFWVCGYDFGEISSFGRWDSGLYLSIAADGYVLEPAENGIWNGNCGWFYLYPLMMKCLNALLGIGYDYAGRLISVIFTWALIYRVTKIIELQSLEFGKIAKMFSILFFPAGVYLVTIFPISVALYFVASNLFYIQKREFLKSGLCGFLASASYSTAFLVCGVDVIMIGAMGWLERWTAKEAVKNVCLSSGVSFLGYLSFMVILYFKTGYWNAFFLVQAKYGHGINNPLKTCFDVLRTIMSDGDGRLIGLISVAIFLYFVTLTMYFISNKLWRNPGRACWYYWGALIYIFMLVMGSGVSPMRQYCLMSLSILCVESKYLISGVLAVSLLLFQVSCYLYLSGVSV